MEALASSSDGPKAVPEEAALGEKADSKIMLDLCRCIDGRPPASMEERLLRVGEVRSAFLTGTL